MRFTVAWAHTAAQNTVLKVTVVTLSLLSTVLTVANIRLSQREPLVIDRACRATAVKPSDGARISTEIEGFLRQALSERFDTNGSLLSDHLSLEEREARRQEQEELRTSQLTQRLVFNAVRTEKGIAHVDADRLVSFGQVRSAFPFPLDVTLEIVTRTEGNPSGLQIVKVVPTRVANEGSQEAKR